VSSAATVSQIAERAVISGTTALASNDGTRQMSTANMAKLTPMRRANEMACFRFTRPSPVWGGAPS
jgi:hypothetical protein